MTSKFDDCDLSGHHPSMASSMSGNSSDRSDSHSDALQLSNAAQVVPLRDRFELLSAYLDGEITAAERRQVEDWLANDPSVQCLYARLLKLRQGLRSIPVPPATQPVEQTVKQVFSRIDRRPRQRALWGGIAIAAMFLGVISDQLPGVNRTASQVSEVPQAPVSSDALMIALDRPVIEIPKAPVSTPGFAVEQTIYSTHDSVR